jgi:hypothetical protein
VKPVGIIANPASGKDIRRLVAHGSVFGNMEKINIIRRVLIGLDAVGVEEVHIMPDFAGLGIRALGDINLQLKAVLLEMQAQGNQEDSKAAAEKLAEMDAACIITLGGDGTNRVVAKACGDIPLLPISTGTNNVFPFMVEGTLAGMAAGAMAYGMAGLQGCCHRTPCLELRREDRLVDIALVDLVVLSPGFIAARALWEVEKIREIYLARAQPGDIGFSSVGGTLCPLDPDARKALHITVGPGKERVKSPIAPGLISWLPISARRSFGPEEEIPIAHAPCIIALDGERELSIPKEDRLNVRVNPEGPLVVDIRKVLSAPAVRRLFTENQG